MPLLDETSFMLWKDLGHASINGTVMSCSELFIKENIPYQYDLDLKKKKTLALIFLLQFFSKIYETNVGHMMWVNGAKLN